MDTKKKQAIEQVNRVYEDNKEMRNKDERSDRNSSKGLVKERPLFMGLIYDNIMNKIKNDGVFEVIEIIDDIIDNLKQKVEKEKQFKNETLIISHNFSNPTLLSPELWK